MGDGWQSGAVSERAYCLLAPNPGPMTLEGTNTWVLLEPGSTEAVVVDPGPLHLEHLETVLRFVESRGARVALTLLTHHHQDHAEAAEHFAAQTAAPVRAIGTGHDDLADGETVRVGGLEVTVVTTPGHTGDSVSFLLPAESALLTGDTVLGRGTTVVAWPDGELAAYLASLERIERSGGVRGGGADPAGTWPTGPRCVGHGPVLPRPPRGAARRGPGRSRGRRHRAAAGRRAGLRGRPEGGLAVRRAERPGPAGLPAVSVPRRRT